MNFVCYLTHKSSIIGFGISRLILFLKWFFVGVLHRASRHALRGFSDLLWRLHGPLIPSWRFKCRTIIAFKLCCLKFMIFERKLKQFCLSLKVVLSLLHKAMLSRNDCRSICRSVTMIAAETTSTSSFCSPYLVCSAALRPYVTNPITAARDECNVCCKSI